MTHPFRADCDRSNALYSCFARKKLYSINLVSKNSEFNLNSNAIILNTGSAIKLEFLIKKVLLVQPSIILL